MMDFTVWDGDTKLVPMRAREAGSSVSELMGSIAGALELLSLLCRVYNIYNTVKMSVGRPHGTMKF